MSFLKGC